MFRIGNSTLLVPLPRSLKFNENQIMVMVGETGSGKTTQ